MRQWILNNLGLKLLSIFLAVLLWAVVLGEQKVEVSIDLPFELPIPAGLVVVNEPPEALEVQLRGPRTLVRSVVPREVVLGRLTAALEEGENLIPIRRELVRVPRGIEVVDVTPRRLRIVLEPLEEREAEVVPRLEGLPANGQVVLRATASPARIKLEGPPSELKRLSRVRTQPVSVQGQNGTITARVMVEPLGGRIRIPDEGPIIVTVEIGPRKS
jgi:hypothetical protein